MSASGTASAERLIPAWAVSSWVGVPWAWSARASVVATPSLLAPPKAVSTVTAPNASRPWTWSLREAVPATPLAAASPTAELPTAPKPGNSEVER